MGFGWEEVHEVAEQIEHIHSPKFFAKMDEMLDYPGVDPHGSPIPDKKGNIQFKSYDPLSSFSKGDQVKLVAVTNSGDDFLKFLNTKKLQIDSVLEVLDKEEFDQSMTVKYDHQEMTLSSKVTEKLLVERL